MPYEERQTLGQGIPVYTHNWIRLLKDQQGTFCVQNLRTGSTEIVLSEEGHSPVDGIAVGVPIRLLQPHPSDSVIFYLVIAAAGVAMFLLSFLIYATLKRALSGQPFPIRQFLETLPGAALNIALAVAGASIYLVVGLRGIGFALTAVFVFSYMAYLLDQSRRREKPGQGLVRRGDDVS